MLYYDVCDSAEVQKISAEAMSMSRKKQNTGLSMCEAPTEPPVIREENETPADGIGEIIRDTGSIISVCGKYTVQVMTIIGQIEGHYILPPHTKSTKYEHIIPQLVAAQQDAVIDGLMIILNTVGGDVEAGLAIAELVAGMSKPVVSLVLGGGHSIGVPIAVAAKSSFIARTATMTIHPVRMNGLMLGVPQAFEYFQRMQRRITSFVTRNSAISPERYNELALNTDELVMDIGTILDGEEAVSEGLIDSVGTLDDAFSALFTMIDESRSPAAGQRKKGTKKKTERK